MRLWTTAAAAALTIACSTPASASVHGMGSWKCRAVPWNTWDHVAQWAMGYMSATAEIVDDTDLTFPENDAAIKRFAARFGTIQGIQPTNRLLTTAKNYIAAYCNAHPNNTVHDATERFMYTNLQSQFYEPSRRPVRR